MLRHIVLMKLNDPADVAECDDRLQAMGGRIPECLSLGTGRNVREHAAAYDISLVTEHADLDGLAAYLAHPVHQEFLEWLNPRIAARAVVDHY